MALTEPRLRCYQLQVQMEAERDQLIEGVNSLHVLQHQQQQQQPPQSSGQLPDARPPVSRMMLSHSPDARPGAWFCFGVKSPFALA